MKTTFPSLGASPRKVTEVRLLHPLKAHRSMLVTPSGILMLVRLVQTVPGRRSGAREA
ncbi:hypothetical protein OAF75_03750 [Verrucomicrobiales bacterium]|nr:hypothetical protein [Verrucomicrobiales bacterium]